MRTKNIILVSLLCLFIAADILLLNRYISWDSQLDELIPFMGFTLLAEAVIIYAIYTYGQLINPFTLYAIFIYTAGFSFIRISSKQQPYDFNFTLLILLSILCFIAGGLVATKTFKFSFKNISGTLSPKLSFTFLLLVLLVGMGVFVMEIRQLGYLPVLNLGNAVYNDLNENEVTPLHNFIVLNSVLPAMFYINYKKGNISFLLFLGLAFISGFIILNFFSRQILILFFFSMLIAVNYYRSIPVARLMIIGSVVLVLFIVLGQLRNSSAEEDSKELSVNEFLKEYNSISKPTNILETYLSLYGGVNFTTAFKITEQARHDGYYGYGVYAARPVITVLPVNKTAVYPETYSSYIKLGTYITDPFLDFRWAGVIIFNFLYGYLAMNSFKNYLDRKSEYYIVEWSLFIFCIFMCSFTSFFHMFFVVFFFIINRIAIK